MSEQSLETDIREIRKDVKILIESVAGLKVKSGLWGAIGGSLPMVAWVFYYFAAK